jgi:NAD(P)-dependent dehydrogenase (short-subunit alcohol dehydrogenase family)
MDQDVVVVIGAGGIGLAIARRQGMGKRVLLADYSDEVLQGAAGGMRDAGYDVTAMHVDVADRSSVEALAKAASGLGPVAQVVHTAGLSPNMAPADRILTVDLYGTALVLEVFGGVIANGGAGVVISSMAGHMGISVAAENEPLLATTPADELLALPFLQEITEPGHAYGVSKRGNALRVQAECLRWAERGARVNAISPGIILTPLAQHELASETGPRYMALVEASATKRMGSAEEVAAAAAYLLGPEAAFVTGTDLLIDGGVIAAMRMGRLG